MSNFATSKNQIIQLASHLQKKLQKSQPQMRIGMLADGFVRGFDYGSGGGFIDEFKQIVKVFESGFEQSNTMRLVVCSTRVDLSKLASIHSSRRHKDLESQTIWFDYLRTALASVRRKKLSVISAKKTTCHPFVQRGAELYRIPFFDLEFPKGDSIDVWIDSLIGRKLQESVIYLSPDFLADNQTDSADRLMMVFAKHIFVIAANKKGNTLSSSKGTLQVSGNDKSFFVANEDQLIEESIRHELSGMGAVKWLLLGADWGKESFVERGESDNELDSSQFVPLAKWNESKDFVYHCTRQRRGVWPEQSEQELIDQLLTAEAESRTPCDVLIRIASMQKLISTNELNRAKTNVVCFTGRPLEEVKSMRVFRSHLSKWDFEPFGIGIRKSAFEKLGGRPVQYGTNESFDRMDETDRPFFQLAVGQSNSQTPIDWTVEREWRVIGDMDLEKISKDDMIFFVADQVSAIQLQKAWSGRIVLIDNV